MPTDYITHSYINIYRLRSEVISEKIGSSTGRESESACADGESPRGRTEKEGIMNEGSPIEFTFQTDANIGAGNDTARVTVYIYTRHTCTMRALQG